MAMKGHIPGGGIASNKVTERPVRTGAGAKGINPGWVGQRGQKQGAHITNKGRDTGYHGEPRSAGPGFNPTKYGNEVALMSVRAGLEQVARCTAKAAARSNMEVAVRRSQQAATFFRPSVPTTNKGANYGRSKVSRASQRQTTALLPPPTIQQRCLQRAKLS